MFDLIIIHDCLIIYFPAQPVHDELEYIKMRYQSPARQSFRGNKAYENLTIRSDATTTLEGRVYRQQSSDAHPPSKIRSTSGSTLGKSDKIPIFTDCIDSQNDSPWLEGKPTMQLNAPAVDADETQTRIPPDVWLVTFSDLWLVILSKQISVSCVFFSSARFKLDYAS